MTYNLRNKRKKDEISDNDDNDNNNKKLKDDSSSNDSDSEYTDDDNSINSEDLTDIDELCDDDNVISHNLDLLNDFSLRRQLTKSILIQLKTDLDKLDYVNIEAYLSELENKVNTSELVKDENNKNNVVNLSAIELSNSILKNLISEIRYEYHFNNMKLFTSEACLKLPPQSVSQ